jgi:hypothetical protein
VAERGRAGGLDTSRRVGGHVSIDSGASQGFTRIGRGASLFSNEDADTKKEDEICVTIDEYCWTTKARRKLVVAHLSFEQRTMITNNEHSHFSLIVVKVNSCYSHASIHTISRR